MISFGEGPAERRRGTTALDAATVPTGWQRRLLLAAVLLEAAWIATLAALALTACR